MNKKKILQLVLATSAVAGGMFLSQEAAIVKASPVKMGYTLNTTTSLQQGQVVNVTTNLRVRSGAGQNYSTLGYLNNGTKISINGESGNWYKISFNNKDGYVSKEYIKLLTVTTSTQTSASSNVGIIKVTSSLRVRSGTSTNSSVLGYLTNGTKVTITGQDGDWYTINYNNKKGYISKSYVTLLSNSASTGTSTSSTSSSNKTGTVVNITSNLRVRAQANASSSVLGYLINGSKVTITGESGDWYAINFNGKIGYVSKSYIAIGDEADSSTTYNTILASMKAHIGSPYVWGGSGEFITKALLDSLSKRYPSQAANGAYTRAYAQVDSGKRAFDCSGLMQWGYAQAGISIGRSTWDQIENGVEVSLSDVKPGDLLFTSSLGHVGMYIGNGQWIESPNKSADVRIASVPWSSIGRARRILN